MSYEVTDGRVSYGQFASNGGYADLVSYVNNHAIAYPKTQAFLLAGKTDNGDAVFRELLGRRDNPPADVASCMSALALRVRRMRSAVVTDGLTGGDDIVAFNPDEARDKEGKWTDDGGASDFKPDDVAKYTALKTQMAQINTSLLPFVDTPDAPEVQQKMDEMRAVSQQMAQLHVDTGKFEDVGLPGGPRDLLVVGAGPGGLTSAVMGATDGLDTMVVESQDKVGGQAKFSSRIENYPGFPIGISGSKLAANMVAQATRLGAQVTTGKTAVGLSYDAATGLKTVTLASGEKIQARAVVLAGGVVFKKLDFPGSDSPDVIYGNGQMLHDNYAGKPVVILGGSNGAAQAALGASLTASKVYLISRSPLEKAMSDYQVQAVRNHANIQVIENDQIARAFCDENNRVQAIDTDKGLKIPANAVGVFVGSAPKTDWLPPEIERQYGKIKTNMDLETGLPGVYAIGDARVGSIGRVGSAVGDGQMAERNAFAYFVKKQHKVAAAGDASRQKLGRLIDALFDLDKANPYPLIQSVEQRQKKTVKAYSPDEARDADGEWTTSPTGVKFSPGVKQYAKNLQFTVRTADAALRAQIIDSVNSGMQKYSQDETKQEYKDSQIDAWMKDYDALRAGGAPEDKATLQAAAEGKGLYPEAAASAGIVPMQVKDMQRQIDDWSGGENSGYSGWHDYATFGDAAKKAVDGSPDADPAMVLEYAHTQAALHEKALKRNQSPDTVHLYRGLDLRNSDVLGGQAVALKALINSPDWSVDFKVAAADSWTPDKYKAYEFMGTNGLVLGEDIPTANVITSQHTNPFGFRRNVTEQEYIVAHPTRIMQLAKTHTEVNAALSEVLQAISTLRAAGWKVTVVGKHITLQEPHPNPGWLHKKSKSDVKAGRALDDKYEYQGLPISIETKKGNARTGKKPDGTPWSVIMPYDYGYIRGTMGVDGDHVDCFIGPMKDAKFAYIIHQTKIGSDNYDEDKCMLGFPSSNMAKKAYSSAYDDGKGTMHSMTMLPMSTFIEKVMKTKDRPSKIHAGGVMNIAASVDLTAGGPGSGRHPEGGSSLDRDAVEKWLTDNGFEPDKRNDTRVGGQHFFTKTVHDQNPEAIGFESTPNAQVHHTVMVNPDGSWQHTSEGAHTGTGTDGLSKYAMTAKNKLVRRFGPKTLLIKPRSVGNSGVKGRGYGLDMLERHMRRAFRA